MKKLMTKNKWLSGISSFLLASLVSSQPVLALTFCGAPGPGGANPLNASIRIEKRHSPSCDPASNNCNFNLQQFPMSWASDFPIDTTTGNTNIDILPKGGGVLLYGNAGISMSSPQPPNALCNNLGYYQSGGGCYMPFNVKIEVLTNVGNAPAIPLGANFSAFLLFYNRNDIALDDINAFPGYPYNILEAWRYDKFLDFPIGIYPGIGNPTITTPTWDALLTTAYEVPLTPSASNPNNMVGNIRFFIPFDPTPPGPGAPPFGTPSTAGLSLVSAFTGALFAKNYFSTTCDYWVGRGISIGRWQ